MAASSAPQGEGIATAFARLIESPALFPLIGFVLVLTSLLVAIEILAVSKSRFRSCFQASSFFYLFILFVGNSVASMIVLIPYVDDIVPGRSMGYALFASFFGVFSFEGILSNTNVTVFNHGVLTIADWIWRARDGAIAATTKQDVATTINENRQLTDKLRALPEQDLNALVESNLGNGSVVRINQGAAAANADPRYSKALEL